MAGKTAIDRRALERLFAEVAAYLAVVEAFRREGLEPRWVPERSVPARTPIPWPPG